VSSSDIDARYVNITGDTMTGGLTAPSVAVAGDTLRIATPKTIASQAAGGNIGDIHWDDKYIYLLIGPGQWRQIPHFALGSGPVDPSKQWIAGGDIPGLGELGLLAFGGGNFLCSRAYSGTGASWTEATGVAGGRDVYYTEPLGCFRITQLDRIHYLAAGGEWLPLSVGEGYDSRIFWGMAYNGTTWVASLTVDAGSRNVLLATSDIVNGPYVEVPNVFDEDVGGLAGRVFAGNGTFVMVSRGSGRLFYSANGADWNQCTGTAYPIQGFTDGTYAAYLGGKWVLVNSESIYTSTDGAVWQEISTPGYAWVQVAHNGRTGEASKYVAVTVDGKWGYSKDAETWTLDSQLISDFGVKGVAFGATASMRRFVAISDAGVGYSYYLNDLP